MDYRSFGGADVFCWCLGVFLFAAYHVESCLLSLCSSLQYCIYSLLRLGLMDMNLNLVIYLFFWFASFWLHSTAVSDQTQVVCVHQASVFGGGAGSHTSSTSPSGISSPRHQPVSFCTGSACWQVGFFEQISIGIRKSFIAKCVCTHKEFVLVLGASSTESTNIVQTTYN